MKFIIYLTMFSLAYSKFVSKYQNKHPNQQLYQTYIEDKHLPIVVASGSAGTGKTLISCHTAIKLFQENVYKKIIITRPLITVEEDMGYLPGTIEDKMHPYLIPFYDYFLDYYSKEKINSLINNGQLEISPLAFMRGRTFKDSIIIADEMQNSSINQMKMLLSRLGVNSKLIIMGDLNQSDLTTLNGLNDFTDVLLKKYSERYLMHNDGFGYIHLDNSCIMRHKIIEKVLDLYK